MSGNCTRKSSCTGAHAEIRSQPLTNDDVNELDANANESVLIEDLKSRVNSMGRISDVVDNDEIVQSYQEIIKRVSSIDIDQQEEVLQQLIQDISETSNNEKYIANEFLQLTKESFVHAVSVFLGSLKEAGTGNIFERFEKGVTSWNVFKSHNKALAKHLEDEYCKLTLNVEKALADLDLSNPQLLVKLSPFFEKLLQNWSSPLEFELKQQEVADKQILVIRKPVLLLSKEISKVEEVFANAEVDEIYFIAKEVFYIDHALNNTEWHGKNVFVVSKKVECILPNLTWDLSGLSGLNAPNVMARDDTSKVPNGCDGADGAPGERGGNVVIIADKIIRLSLLTIKSNGGNGGNGQPGGNGRAGKDGEDGKDLPFELLKNEFRPPAKDEIEGIGMSINTIVNLRKHLENIETCWTYNLDEKNAVPLYSPTSTSRGYYLKGTTKEGVGIEFGYYSRKIIFYVTRSAYCIISGIPGTPGIPGGFGGLGGAGGESGNAGSFGAYCLNGSHYEFDTAAEQPLLLAENGESGHSGSAGEDGNDGNPGRNGMDIGYVDTSRWDEAVYFPPGKYDLISDDTGDDLVFILFVWCSYSNKSRHFEPVARVQTAVNNVDSSRTSGVKHRIKRGRRKGCIDIQKAMVYVNEVETCDISSALNELWPENVHK